MSMKLIQATAAHTEVLRNLLEKYLYEFGQYDGRMPGADGLYGYRWLPNYFTDDDRYAFLLMTEEGLPAGFAMVNKHFAYEQDCDWAVAEFFVLHGYRRGGAGSAMMRELFAKFPGKWEIMYHPNNKASVVFWNRMGAEQGQYRKVQQSEVCYDDGTAAEFVYCVSGEK